MGPNYCGAQNQWPKENSCVCETATDAEYEDEGLPPSDSRCKDVSYFEQKWCRLRADFEQGRRDFERIICDQQDILQGLRGIAKEIRQMSAQVDEMQQSRLTPAEQHVATNEDNDDYGQSCGECECGNYMGEQEVHECD